jgi:branched-subunit amino acid ABC-type transport system permease component
MSSGLALVYGVLRVFNMALGQIALMSGYVTWWLTSHGSHLLLAMTGGILTALLITWICFEGWIAPFYKRHRFLPLVTTIAMGMILDGLIIIFFGTSPKTILQQSHLLPFQDFSLTLEQSILIGITIIIFSATAWVLHSTSLGRALRATTQNPEAAESLGIHSKLLHRMVFLVSGMLAGAGGIFIGIDQNLSPTLGLTITIKAYAAVTAAGLGNLWGTVLCAYSIALLEQLVIGLPWFGMYLPSGYQNSIALVVIIVVLLWKPDGIFRTRSRIS